MEHSLFDADHCKESILQAIQPEIESIDAINQKKQAIAAKLIENGKELRSLQKNHAQLSNMHDCLGESLEDHEQRLEKISKLNNRMTVLTSFESNLKKEDAKCTYKLSLAKEALFKSFHRCTAQYVMKSRKGVIDAFERIINADDACFSLLYGLFMQVANDNGINTSFNEFSGNILTLNLCPLRIKKVVMKSAIDEYRNAEIKI